MANDPILHLLVSDPESESETSADDSGGRGIDDWPGQVKSVVKSVKKLATVEVRASAIRPHMEELLNVVGEVFSQADQQPGLALDEIELSVDINAKGQVRILGSGAEVGSTGSIKLKFKRVP
ncbi:hypothetical protein H6F46_13775 [Limnothrix sp. FACHB-1083]|uniref:Pepco domain-containing protein n=1 Tax=unclassified Limnothrix TaxID=2632864 RepID=UPI00168009CA|nr:MULTISPECIES: hypothetical protein [unclassified Limnothrix]MBD2161760.1 hypothetical protein [Limnothrix sp. FACHB-1083]MBD2192663.1 hypothetical protein [Limnothrix sp. FACHB-1088]